MAKLQLQAETHRLRQAITAMKVWSFDKAKAILAKPLTTPNLRRVVRT